MKKIIFAAIAAPGAGKTQALINQLKNSVKSGEKVVIALPTLKLNQEIIGRMETAGLKPRVINSEETDGKPVSQVINGVLQNGNESIILVTHEGILRSDPSFLKGYTLIFDEVPSAIELDHFAMKLDEAREILDPTEIIGNQLKIKQGLVTKIKNRVGNYKKSSSDRVLKSVLSQAEYKVFSTILNNNIVHIEQGKLEDKEVIHFHVISEKDYLPHINASKECHILAANIQGGLFDLLVKNAGISYKKSKFTPAPFAYTCDITIYPMLNKSWSKTQALKSDGGNRWDHQGNVINLSCSPAQGKPPEAA
uniref:DEAD/DEAH box helicase n=1 Tax=Pseudomonas nitroreducens TaxID=46680 RepID=UPI002D7EBA2C